ncbi:MAG: DUF4421 domain-containing protein [Cyclobacteriaceae bacterium]|jgi:hypothetical protein|nr:DUF4421 domain-containing protein [Cyclobacteriaceae bacterium]
MRYAWLLLMVMAGVQTHAQTDSLAQPSSHDSLSAHFIRRFPDHFNVWGVLKSRSLGFDARNINTNEVVRYRPNSRTSLGVGVYLFEVAAELAFAVPEDQASTAKFGDTDVRDLQLNVIGKFWGVDAYWQRYEGFYLDDASRATNNVFPQRADIESRNFGLSGFYVFDRNRFSLRSAYNFSEQQLKNRGSWMIIGTINSFRISGDSSLRSGSDVDTDFMRMRYTTFGLAPGYSYTYVYQKFFANGTLGFGPAHNWVYVRLANGQEVNNVSINSYAIVRLALGYNSERFFGGVGFSLQSRNLRVDDIRYSNSTSIVKLMLGYRFREFGFLKKRAVDWVKGI